MKKYTEARIKADFRAGVTALEISKLRQLPRTTVTRCLADERRVLSEMVDKGMEVPPRLKKHIAYHARLVKSWVTRKEREGEQLCWSCQKACGRCSWSAYFKPVNGWDAVPTVVHEHGNSSDGRIIYNYDVETFYIRNCPEYIQDVKNEKKKN